MDRFLVICMWGLIAIVVAVLVLGIWGLIESVPVLDEGVVIDKWHEPEGTTYMIQKVGNVHRLFPIVEDEDWVLQVQGMTKDGKQRTESWEVPRETYEQTAVGDRVTR